ncbi:hypothetical protein EC991775_1522, partial [Escherichia coli 99.1775]
KVTDVLQTGQQIWVRQVGDAWWLAQVPEVNSALVSINPQKLLGHKSRKMTDRYNDDRGKDWIIVDIKTA